jgi:hypothetical protein
VGAAYIVHYIRNAYKILTGKNKRKKRALDRSRRKWEITLKWILKETGWNGVNWIRVP